AAAEEGAAAAAEDGAAAAQNGTATADDALAVGLPRNAAARESVSYEKRGRVLSPSGDGTSPA
ncbi:hypothetical protein ACFR97_15320, partial [Haloplanus litoreus]|uniref:hypothetical protein n=1 Tax=Haloplanus litoreus TaxID=767515 RepID=UPI0036254004